MDFIEQWGSKNQTSPEFEWYKVICVFDTAKRVRCLSQKTEIM